MFAIHVIHFLLTVTTEILQMKVAQLQAQQAAATKS